MELCRASHPIWNPKEQTLYLGGLNCVRKVVERPDGSHSVELVAGVPYQAGNQDGPAKEATFQSFYRGAVCNSRGTVFWLEDQGLRRIEDGTVSSVPLKFTEKEESFCFIMRQNLLSLGENDDTLYISDTYGSGHQRILAGSAEKARGSNGLQAPARVSFPLILFLLLPGSRDICWFPFAFPSASPRSSVPAKLMEVAVQRGR